MMQFGYRPHLRMPPPPQGVVVPGITNIGPLGPIGAMNPMGAINPMGAMMPPPVLPGEPLPGFDGKMLRKSMARKTVDYNSSAVKLLEDRIWKRDYRDERALQADNLYTPQMSLPQDMLENPVNCVTTRFIRVALNKDPRPIFCCCWTPDGRRLITGASSGEFTLWNGLTFNFETILQAHNSSVRSMIWSRNEQWMLTGDDKGYVKYWQANMNNVKMFQGHFEAIRGLSFSPTDAKFVSCSDDRSVRIFDFVTCTEETVLNGHGSDVKCVDWHPHKALIISGSKDSQQPIILWDPRSNKKMTTLHAHKNTCTDLKWNQFNGNWLVSSSKDHLCKLFDIRNLKEEVQSFRGHKKDACTVAWHPIHEKLFATGGADGSIFFWLVGAEKELANMEMAHESLIWDLSWHPLGHMLVSGSNDRSTRFWTRNRPGDTFMDKTDEANAPKAERVTGIIFNNIELPELDKQKEGLVSLPGLGFEKDMIDLLNDESKEEVSVNVLVDIHSPSQVKKEDALLPGLDLDDEESRKRKAPYAKPIPREFEKAWKSNKLGTQPSAATTQAAPNILPMGGIIIDPMTKMPSMAMPPPGMILPPGVVLHMHQTPPVFNPMMAPPPIPSPTQQQQQQPPQQQHSPSENTTSTTSNKNTEAKNHNPLPLMDLMSTQIEPASNSLKRKMSEEHQSSPLNNGNNEKDSYDDSQWQQPKSKQFYQKSRREFNNNTNNNNNNNNNNSNYGKKWVQ